MKVDALQLLESLKDSESDTVGANIANKLSELHKSSTVFLNG